MKWKLGLYRGYLCSILVGDTMVPKIEEDHILLLGYSILYKEYYLTRFNHKETLFKCVYICIYICVPFHV